MENLDKFIQYCQKVTDDYMSKNFPTLPLKRLTIESGSRYIKIIEDGVAGSRSVFGFVDKTNGDLLKAASWKAPAKNFARGNLNDASTWKCVGPHAIG